jgi:uncharacterized protein DUF2752
MRLVRRPLAPGAVDHELIWLPVSLVSLALAAGWFVLALPWPHCLFLATTGHPCLTCGATRCAIAFFHLEFWRAFQWNPLVFVVLCGFTMFDAYAFAILVFRLPRLRLQFSSREKNVVRYVAVTALLLNWIYLLTRPPGIF